MPQNSLTDPSKRAGDFLNEILKEKDASQPEGNEEINSTVPEEAVAAAERVSIDAVMAGDSVLEVATNRDRVRLLVITKNESFLHGDSSSIKRLIDVCQYFLEIHVVVLNIAGQGEAVVGMRASERVWVYPVNARSWWSLTYEAYKLACSQLLFSGSFRADIIVAEDPYESGLVGTFLAKKFTRALQVHFYEDISDRNVVAQYDHPMLYEWCMEYVLEYAKSVRTKNDIQYRAVLDYKKGVEAGLEVLPSHYSLDAWNEAVPAFDLHERYPQFKFILVHTSSLRKTSHTETVIDGVAEILKRYPSIGLLIVGSGPLRSSLERRVVSLGIQRQVVFEPSQAETISHLKTANAFIQLSDDSVDDESILMAAVAKTPLIVSRNGIAGRIFTDGQSAHLCDPNDAACVTNSLNHFLNENHDRAEYARNAYDAVFVQVKQDYSAYLDAYAQSIERALIDDEVR